MSVQFLSSLLYNLFLVKRNYIHETFLEMLWTIFFEVPDVQGNQPSSSSLTGNKFTE